MTDIAIAIRNLSKQYLVYRKPLDRIRETFSPFGKKYHTPFNALRNINLTVPRGQSIGIIGRNGSGKSTLLQIMCGVLQPTAGQVTVNGRISALLELGAGFNPEFTGRENVYMSTAILGLSRRQTDARFQQIVDFADIGEFIDRPVKTYSSGMYIRLAFATAISVDPEVLIIDEALAVGDIFFQQKCMQHMRKMMAQCTIALVSHDMHSVTNLCDRVVVLDEGRIVFDGKPPEGVAKYTKILHNEEFKKKQRRAATDLLEIPAAVARKAAAMNPEFSRWLVVTEEETGGAGEVVILRVFVSKDGLPAKTVSAGDRIEVHMLVRAFVSKKEVIFGYTIKDRVGNAIFGENSFCLADGPRPVEKGYSLVSFSFAWPEVYPDDYTITLGIGEGRHPLAHKIQCWAHNIFSLSAIAPGKAIHGMFNNPLDSLEVTCLDACRDAVAASGDAPTGCET